MLNFFELYSFFSPDSVGGCRSKKLSNQELGIAKLAGFREWFSIHPLFAESNGGANLELDSSSHKMLIFAHHHKVLDGVQVKFFRIGASCSSFENGLNSLLKIK